MEGYDCFLSYSHAADSRLATALRTGLHRFAKPWYRVRALRVFRDDSSLSASPHLWHSIEQALRSSRWLVLLASPRAADSAWVGRELDTWCAAGGADRLLIVLTDGELEWDAAAGDFDWERTTALPSALRGRLGDEPRHVDARWVATAADTSLRNPRFRDLVAELTATVHGRPKDELIGEDVHQYRRTRLLFRSLVAGLVAFATAVSVTACVAVEQRNRAREERDNAMSRMLAAQAVTDRPARLDRSLLLSLAALKVRDTIEARSALLGSIEYLPQLTRFLSYGGRPATAVAAAPRGGVVATAHDRDVVLWDTATDRPAGKLAGPGAAVVGIGFGPDGSVLTSVDAQGEIIHWRVRDRAVLHRTAPPRRSVEHAAISPDGTRVALLGNGSVTLWNGKAFAPLRSPGEVLSIAISPDGHTLAYGLDEGIRFVDLRSNRPSGPEITIEVGDYSQRIGALAFSPDGDLLASGGGGGGGVDLWRTSDHEQVGHFGYVSGERPPVTALAFVNDGAELVAADREGMLTRWDVIEQQQVGDLLPSQGVVVDLAAGPGSTELVAATADGAAARWDLGRSMRLGRGLSEGTSEVASAVAFTPDGRYLAAGEMDRIEVFDTRTRRAVTEPLVAGEELFVDSLAFDPTGAILAAGMSDGHVRLWDARTWRRLPADLPGHQDDVTGVAFDQGGDLLVSSGVDGKVLMWNARTFQRVETTLGAGVTGIALQRRGGLLAVARADGRIAVQDPRVPQPRVVTLPGHPGGVLSMAFSPDGRSLASSGTDGRVVLWDVRAGTQAGEPLAQEEADLGTVAFSEDGTMLAVGVRRTFVLWDVASRQRLGHAVTGTLDAVVSLAFSRDGLLAWGSLAIAPTSELVAVWDARPAAWGDLACAVANRQLSEQEWDRFVGAEMPHDPLCRGA